MAFAIAADKTQVQSHDNNWQVAWVNRARIIYQLGEEKIAAKVLVIGDSISHANPAHRWVRTGSGRTAEDLSIIQLTHMDTWDYTSNTNAAHNSGGYLAGADTSPARGMIAASGITTEEILNGAGNGGAAMPSVVSSMAAARGAISDGVSYTANIHIDTLVAAFSDAQFAFVMLGTNDISNGRSAAEIITDLQTIIAKLEAAKIAVVLCTVPPRVDTPSNEVATANLNMQIRTLAQQLSVALLDVEFEHLLRDEDSSDLLGVDGIHPTAVNGSVTPGSDPYAPDGNAAAHSTGSNAAKSGYLLHAWLRTQKLKEIQQEIVDGGPPGGEFTIPVLPKGYYFLLLGLFLGIFQVVSQKCRQAVR